MKNKKGIVYLAFGHLYLVMALFSIYTLKKKNSELPVMLITNLNFNFKKLDFWSKNYDTVKILNITPDKSREIKTDLWKFTPFDQTAFIDADTYILSELSTAWKFLDYFDIALKVNSLKQLKPGKGDQLILDSSTYVRDITHFNSGVIFFNKSNKTENFFRYWSKNYLKGKSIYDQVSLVETIFKCEAKILPLTEEWNYFPDEKYFAAKVESPKILHYTNRISYSLEIELLKIANSLGFEIDKIKKAINLKRLDRKKKIGRFKWFQMLFYWRFFANHEKKNWFL